LAGMFFKYSKYSIDQLSQTFDLTSHFQDSSHCVISRNKVMPPSE